MKTKLLFLVGIIVCNNIWGMITDRGIRTNDNIISQTSVNNPVFPPSVSASVDLTASIPFEQEDNVSSIGQSNNLYPSIVDNSLVSNLTDDQKHLLRIAETQKILNDALIFVRDNTILSDQVQAEIPKIAERIENFKSIAKGRIDAERLLVMTQIMSLPSQAIKPIQVPEKYINLPTWPSIEKLLNHQVSCAQILKCGGLATLGLYGWSKNVFGYLGYAFLLVITWAPIIISFCEMTSYKFAGPITQFIAGTMLCCFPLISMQMKSRK